METTVQRLRYVLEVLAPTVAGKKAMLPILQNVVVGQGKAYATNLETAVTVEFPEATDDSVLLPHREVLSLLRNIPGPARLSIIREGDRIKLLVGTTSRADFPVPAEASEFPPLPKLQPVGEGEVDADLFLKTATAVADYAATNTSRPALQCVCVTLGAPLEMAGADGFRLGWQTLPLALPALNSPPVPFSQLLLPTAAVATLAKVWKNVEKQPTIAAPPDRVAADPLKQDGSFRLAMLAVAKRLATVRFTQRALSFEHGGVTIRVQLTEGEFPNYRALVPADLPHKVSFDAEEALRALRSLHDIASERSGIVRLAWSDGTLALSAGGEETGTISASVRAHIQGEEARIAFDIRYLLEYLPGKLGMVLLETATPSSPGRFFHAGSPDVLIMPLFVSDPAAPTTEPAADQRAVGGPADEEAPEALDSQQVPGDHREPEEPATASSPPARSKKPSKRKSPRISQGGE